ncbi:2-dehydropantoate 2-reductase N-terminal domain-containing protein [Bdellovibrionota bacterium FG-1]
MKILLVGAGAVGQVYGYTLQKAGASVSYFVREKHAEETRRGFELYPLNRPKPRVQPVHFAGFDVLTDLEQVRCQVWDYVIFCMSSAGLRPLQKEQEWLADFSQVIGKTPVVSLQPSLNDREYLERFLPTDQLIFGTISLISYHAPLASETVPTPGTAFWFPPLSKTPFSPKGRAEPVAKLLSRGGMCSTVRNDVTREVAFGAATLMVLLAVLEAEEWSFKKLRHSPKFDKMLQAAQQAMEIVAAKQGARVPFQFRFGLRTFVHALLQLAPHLTPLPLEAFFKAHFIKVKTQTLLAIQDLIKEGKFYQKPTNLLEQLTAELTP